MHLLGRGHRWHGSETPVSSSLLRAALRAEVLDLRLCAVGAMAALWNLYFTHAVLRPTASGAASWQTRSATGRLPGASKERQKRHRERKLSSAEATSIALIDRQLRAPVPPVPSALWPEQVQKTDGSSRSFRLVRWTRDASCLPRQAGSVLLGIASCIGIAHFATSSCTHVTMMPESCSTCAATAAAGLLQESSCWCPVSLPRAR